MYKLNLKTSYKPVIEYYEALEKFKHLGIKHEGAVRSAFQTLLESCGKQFNWTLVPEYQKKRQGKRISIDGALVDQFTLAHGYWEAKDESDDLRKEVKKKFAVGYPNDNIIFQSPERAILYQNNKETLDADLNNADELVRVLELFFDYQPPAFEEWEQAVKRFQEQLPELSDALLRVIDDARINNKAFVTAFDTFYDLCRTSINPNLSEKAVEEMLIQHLLTERIFRTVFHNSEFTQRNVIAKEIESVIRALTSQSFSREEFLKRFDHFYRAIEITASTIDSFSEKQTFLNNIYERFFQGFSVNVADTHGIVYTPQPIVNFMVKSVEDILKTEFGKSLSDENVHILDPFVGTGNFLVRVMEEMKRSSLEQKYKDELHCNEVMLLPYYIASMNIEHEYFQKIGRYEPFEGICLVDTFGLAEADQHSLSFMTEENTERIRKQKASPITVIIGNPPYNVGQLNENDNNKNRKYKVLDKRVAETYAKQSQATNKNALSDPYVKAIRWATDRLKDSGIVALVTNNSFIESIAFDGIRKDLAKDFDAIYILNLGGNVRKNPKLSGTTHNVFGIQVGVSINIFVKTTNPKDKTEKGKIFYIATEEYWRKEQKYKLLDEHENISKINWQEITPDKNHNWLNEGISTDFDDFLPIGDKIGKADDNLETAIFDQYSNGVKTNRDAWAFNFNKDILAQNIKTMIETFNDQVSRWIRNSEKGKSVDDFVLNDETKISWSASLKASLKSGKSIEFDESNIRHSMYHPFQKEFLYFDRKLNERTYVFPYIFPKEKENLIINVTGKGSEKDFTSYLSDKITNLSFLGGGTALQCFPYYIYNEDGSNRRENVTDWALEKFQTHYNDKKITKWDIFYYTYALLHHPKYREKYSANLKRELPRIPFAPEFRSFAEAGNKLADFHVNYETQTEYPLEMVENESEQVNWRVEKMRYNKDKTQIVYNDFLTLSGIPIEAHEYRLGNRSALDWIVDQYQVSTDKRSGITNDPNREDDKQYIVKLIKRIVTVSLETTKIIKELPSL
ncbi:MAG TPA: type ISP restriction/modification enzyme [Pyrinomonadaceae bacterium]|jgi:predicted helicase